MGVQQQQQQQHAALAAGRAQGMMAAGGMIFGYPYPGEESLSFLRFLFPPQPGRNRGVGVQKVGGVGGRFCRACSRLVPLMVVVIRRWSPASYVAEGGGDASMYAVACLVKMMLRQGEDSAILHVRRLR